MSGSASAHPHARNIDPGSVLASGLSEAPVRRESRSTRSNPMMRSLVGMAAVAAVVSVAMAQSDPVAQRKALMKANGQNAGALNRMVRGEEPFDAAKVNAAFVQFSETAEKLPTLFPEPPKSGEDTRALPKIWETKSDFDARIVTFRKAVEDNKDKAKTLDELKVVLPQVSKTCGDCHEPYRRPQQR
jgi:cytochrome c556